MSLKPLLELGALLKGTETKFILKCRRVVPDKLPRSGFSFEFPSWQDAVEDLVRPSQ